MSDLSTPKPQNQKQSYIGVEFKPKRNSDVSYSQKMRAKRMRKKERFLQEKLEKDAKLKAKAEAEEAKRRKN